MKSRLISVLAAAGMAMASVGASAATSIDRAGPAIGAVSFLQDGDGEGGMRTEIILGVVLIVLIGVVAISGTSNEDAAGSP